MSVGTAFLGQFAVLCILVMYMAFVSESNLRSRDKYRKEEKVGINIEKRKEKKER